MIPKYWACVLFGYNSLKKARFANGEAGVQRIINHLVSQTGNTGSEGMFYTVSLAIASTTARAYGTPFKVL
jgi:hypothetical protein